MKITSNIKYKAAHMSFPIANHKSLELLKFLLDPVRLSFSTSRSSLQLTGCIPSEMKGWLKCQNLLLHVQQFSY